MTKLGEARKLGDDVFGNAVREVVVPWLTSEVRERQDGDRWPVGQEQAIGRLRAVRQLVAIYLSRVFDRTCWPTLLRDVQAIADEGRAFPLGIWAFVPDLQLMADLLNRPPELVGQESNN